MKQKKYSEAADYNEILLNLKKDLEMKDQNLIFLTFLKSSDWIRNARIRSLSCRLIEKRFRKIFKNSYTTSWS